MCHAFPTSVAPCGDQRDARRTVASNSKANPVPLRTSLSPMAKLAPVPLSSRMTRDEVVGPRAKAQRRRIRCPSCASKGAMPEHTRHQITCLLKRASLMPRRPRVRAEARVLLRRGNVFPGTSIHWAKRFEHCPHKTWPRQSRSGVHDRETTADAGGRRNGKGAHGTSQHEQRRTASEGIR